MAERDQTQDLHLALGQAIRRALRLGRGRGELGAQLRVQVGLTGCRGAHRVDQLVAGRVLQHVAERAGAHCLSRECRVLLHREDDDRRLRRLLAQLRDGRQARALGEVQVEYEYTRPVRSNVPARRFQIAGFGDDLEPGLGFEHHPQAVSNHLVVVREHDAHGADRSRGVLFGFHTRDHKPVADTRTRATRWHRGALRRFLRVTTDRDSAAPADARTPWAA